MNKHGRKGVSRGGKKGPKVIYRKGKPPKVEQPQVDATRPEYAIGYERGWKSGYVAAQDEEQAFLKGLLDKRNAKDIKGLIEKRLSRG